VDTPHPATGDRFAERILLAGVVGRVDGKLQGCRNGDRSLAGASRQL
jgi:hypothetical protein